MMTKQQPAVVLTAVSLAILAHGCTGQSGRSTETGGTGASSIAAGGNGIGGQHTGGARGNSAEDSLIGGATTGIVSAGAPSTGGGTATGGSGAGGTVNGGSNAGGMESGGVGDGGTAAGGAGTGGTADTSVCGAPASSPLVGWASVAGNGVSTTTGGGDATPITVTTAADLGSAVDGTTPQVVCVQGAISGDISIGSNKMIIGMKDASFTGSIRINGSSNVIVRNLKIVGKNCSDSPSDCSSGSDAVEIQGGAHHLWFDHDDISDGSDGNLDITRASDFVTISWTKFSYSTRRSDPSSGDSGHRFSNLIGHTDNNSTEDGGKLNVTFHHVWWADNVDQRMPRMRYGKIHVFNSLYTAAGNNYCIGVGQGASVRNESNVFVGVNTPVNTTSSTDAGSTVTSIENLYTNTSGNPVTDLGTAFDPPYSYTPEPVDAVEAAVRSGVGPQ